MYDAFVVRTVHVGVCHAQANCTHHPHPGPCGCPDCSKPHPPHFQNNYCENLATVSVSAEEEDLSEGDFAEDSTTRGNGQNGSSRFMMYMVIAAAAMAATGGAAFLMRKRVSVC
jgi:hypothetical protein